MFNNKKKYVCDTHFDIHSYECIHVEVRGSVIKFCAFCLLDFLRLNFKEIKIIDAKKNIPPSNPLEKN